MSLTVLYRGPLSSCNYGCGYCPFAKREEGEEAHAHDGEQLERFVGWCEAFEAPLRVFFTPWGEALTQKRYQRALGRLTHAPHVEKAAIQTNLSGPLDWLDDVEPKKLGVWATYHPRWARRPRFVAHCRRLFERGVSFSVGVVGLAEHLDELLALRAELPSEVYVWVNAVKALAPTYAQAVLEVFRRVDPYFDLNLWAHPSLGRVCAGGHTVISVDGEGVARTCHFLKAPIGNIYQGGLSLFPRRCTAQRCGCHIGYVHLEHLGLKGVFGEGVLERAVAYR